MLLLLFYDCCCCCCAGARNAALRALERFADNHPDAGVEAVQVREERVRERESESTNAHTRS